MKIVRLGSFILHVYHTRHEYKKVKSSLAICFPCNEMKNPSISYIMSPKNNGKGTVPQGGVIQSEFDGRNGFRWNISMKLIVGEQMRMRP